MANKRISQLPYVGNTGYTATDIMPIVNYLGVTSGTTKHTPLSDLKSYIISGLSATTQLYEVGSGTDSTQRIGVSNDASGNYSVVSGGRNNTACGIDSTISGGFLNTTIGNLSVVGGGLIDGRHGGSDDNDSSGVLTYVWNCRNHLSRRPSCRWRGHEADAAVDEAPRPRLDRLCALRHTERGVPDADYARRYEH